MALQRFAFQRVSVTDVPAVVSVLKVLELLLGRTPVWGADRLVAADTTVTETDDLLLVDTTAAARTVTLPAALPNRGRTFHVKLIAGGNNVTVQGTGGELIDGAATKVWNTAQAVFGFRACLATAPATYGWKVI